MKTFRGYFDDGSCVEVPAENAREARKTIKEVIVGEPGFKGKFDVREVTGKRGRLPGRQSA